MASCACITETLQLDEEQSELSNAKIQLFIKRSQQVNKDYDNFVLNNQKFVSDTEDCTYLLMLKFSLTLCLQSEDPSMRSLARSVLFDMFGYNNTDCHGRELKEKLEKCEPVDFSKCVQQLQLCNYKLLRQLVSLFNSSLMV